GINITGVKVIIVLDAERFLKIKKMFERPLRNQIDVASMVLINKVDTVGEDEVQEIEAFVRSLGFEGPVIPVQAEEGQNMERAAEHLMG
ncbi:MAG: GTP-binding protein, partial [Candidatus Methanomethylophilaceae archaeon]|nr:GTP-binding protein [Candidatus Methanomethylophilaceae archaeon]